MLWVKSVDALMLCPIMRLQSQILITRNPSIVMPMNVKKLILGQCRIIKGPP